MEMRSTEIDSAIANQIFEHFLKFLCLKNKKKRLGSMRDGRLKTSIFLSTWTKTVSLRKLYTVRFLISSLPIENNMEQWNKSIFDGKMRPNEISSGTSASLATTDNVIA